MRHIADQLRPIDGDYDKAATKRATVIADAAFFADGYRVGYRDDVIDVTPEDLAALEAAGHVAEIEPEQKK
jgi:hypothetical protein